MIKQCFNSMVLILEGRVMGGLVKWLKRLPFFIHLWDSFLELVGPSIN